MVKVAAHTSAGVRETAVYGTRSHTATNKLWFHTQLVWCFAAEVMHVNRLKCVFRSALDWRKRTYATSFDADTGNKTLIQRRDWSSAYKMHLYDPWHTRKTSFWCNYLIFFYILNLAREGWTKIDLWNECSQKSQTAFPSVKMKNDKKLIINNP